MKWQFLKIWLCWAPLCSAWITTGLKSLHFDAQYSTNSLVYHLCCSSSDQVLPPSMTQKHFAGNKINYAHTLLYTVFLFIPTFSSRMNTALPKNKTTYAAAAGKLQLHEESKDWGNLYVWNSASPIRRIKRWLHCVLEMCRVTVK